MNMTKIALPLALSMALFGCNKAEQKTEAPAPATEPATITASANGATATATVNSANTATATAVDPNMTPEQHKDAREKIMKDWSKANKAMGAMVKDPTKFNAEQFKAEANKLNQDPWGHFADNAKGGDAKDAIWTDKAGFQQEIDKYKSAMTALTTATTTATNVDGVKAQFGDVGASCKSCHDKFKAD
ncbi:MULTISPECIES: c-type cytochrome [unclassified Moraxella]|uniref:c-type cytochrome n=1 Tax=unclassified Moraxella TaxID=2685852 RepID=UPI003AF8A799